MTETQVEFTCIALSLGLYAAYGFELKRDTRAAEPRTAAGIMAPIRRAWLVAVIREGKDILCVQTLRNWTMFASLMASTTILGGIGAVGFALSHDRPPQILAAVASPMGLGGVQGGAYFSFKVICLAGGLFATFLNFASAIRYYNHILVCVAGNDAVEHRTRVALCLLRRGALHQVSGMRFMYTCAALALWVVGAFWLLLGTVLVVFAMRRFDRLRPELEGPDTTQ